MKTPLLQSPALRRWLAVIAGFFVAIVLCIAFFPWDLMRGPINRYVSDKLGRKFEITRHLAVSLGRTITVKADGLELANPEWAAEPYLVKASAAEFDISLWPLLHGDVQLPRVVLSKPEIGLQMEPDGKRTWVLSRDTADANATPDIGSMAVDEGVLKYRAAAQGADVITRFSISAESSTSLPLVYKASGKWRNEAFTASGRTGSVLGLSKGVGAPFPIEVKAATGKTALTATGTVANLASFAGFDAIFDIQGKNLEELYKLAGIVLPSTPPYKLRGKLNKQGNVWAATQISGLLGKSDLTGDLSFDTSGKVALLTGKLQSKVLDFEDLAPVVGLSVPAPKPTSKGKAMPAQAAQAKAQARPAPVSGKLLPDATIDLARLQTMNADVLYSAADIRHVQQLPLDSAKVHVRLTGGVLQLDPIAMGVAGGSVAGRISMDSNAKPAAFGARLAIRSVQVNQLFPTIQTTKSGVGTVSGQFDLKGRGNSVAQMLGSATGDVAVLVGKGQLSNILLEFIGLDGGEVIKFLLRGDRNVELRCGAAAFEVKQGLMTSKVILLDTSDTVINGSGQINLAKETLDLVLKPEPKDGSILSLRSPLKVGGTFASPSAGPDKAALIGRGGLALALGLINPLLALAATIETGPGVDADCSAALASAANPPVKTPNK
jgi:hypothetical protein